MAQHILRMVPVNRRVYPDWIADGIAKGLSRGIISETDICVVKKGLMLSNNSAESYTYLSFATDLPTNKVEVLAKLNRPSLGLTGYIRTNGIFLSENGQGFPTKGIRLALPSGAESLVYASRDNLDHFWNILLSEISVAYKEFYLRVRIEDSTVSMKIWYGSVSEPTDWQLVSTQMGLNITNFGYYFYGDRLSTVIEKIAYATDGESATFEPLPVYDVVGGVIDNVSEGDLINIHDLETHNINQSIKLPMSGSWTANLYNSRPVYARIERASGSEYDLIFAKNGNNYLGGDYPDGALKDDGVPSSGEVRAIYRSDNPILGGVTIAKTIAQQTGEWRISGLKENIPFDVIARKQERPDKLISNVTAVLDPDSNFSLLGTISYRNGFISGAILAKNAALPLTVDFLGEKPYGASVDYVNIENDLIVADIPLRNYGNFDFQMVVTDNDDKKAFSNISVINGERAPFVDFVGAVNSMDRGNVSTPITSVIPNDVLPGDILVLCIMRRGPVSVTDNNGGEWTLGPNAYDTSLFEQGTTIYYRAAKANDAGKTITISTAYSGRMIVYLSAYRGKYAPLRVIKSISNTVRYDNTYSQEIKNLSPINHDSGFIVRAVSNVYAVDPSSAKMIISNMNNTGPEFGDPSRMQVAYKHLPRGGVLDNITYNTASATADDLIPDVAIIIDETRL